VNTFSSTTVLEGHLERITFYNEENHFAIARFRPVKSENIITVLGTLPNPNLGETLKITGAWETNRRYGEQLRIHTVDVVMPATVDGIKRYLESGFIRGIGPKTAARLVTHFQEKTLEIIETAPHRLTEVMGIGRSGAENIVTAWYAHHAIRGLMQFLQECGVKTSYGAKIYSLYGPDAVDIIREDPFRLSEDIPGIGFHVADAVIRYYGIPVDETRRVGACILHLLKKAVDDGHVFQFADQLAKRCVSEFEISTEPFREALEDLEADGEITVTDDNPGSPPAVYPKQLYAAEAGIANKLLAMLSVPVSVPDIDSEDILHTIMRKLAVQLSDEQVAVLKGVMGQRIAIVTGGPGTGKTTLIRSLTAIFEQTGKQILLAAPTGRAARRLGEITGRKAETIHKLLGYSPQTGLFDKNQDDPLTADVVIIDEASMVDTTLMFHLIQAVYLRSRLIFVGDVFQLPSVGAGNVLSDLIRSERIETFELKEIFRQARQSPIIINAHHVREGVKPDFAGDGETLSECCFIEEKNPEIVVRKVIDLCRRRIPEQFGMDPVRDIQVITPMHRGLVGTIHLNQVLQKALNPAAEAVKIMDDILKPGDKVMQLRNDYSKEVFNGDIGTIVSIEKKREDLTVDFDGRRVSYDFTERDDISLAYAITVHKSQGSEYPAVIIPLLTHHYPLLQRNLLYTAISRGRHLTVLIGTSKAFAIALNNNRPQHRLSGLADRLCGT
jgi:exodeoxyribonuclease V alpha subunit